IAQIVIATTAATIVTCALLFLGLGHRTGRVKILQRLADHSERASGLPGWVAFPSAVATASLLTAVFGMYWDISIHIDNGRDAALWGPTHLMLIGGAAMTLVGIAVLSVEGIRANASGATPLEELLHTRMARAIALTGGLMLGLSTFQAEFDFGVPQFQLIFQP